jgi:hypothetical protein
MMDSINRVIISFAFGMLSSLVEYATDIAVGALFEALQQFNPVFIIFSVIFSVISFIFGIHEAYDCGFSYSFSIMIVGCLILKDLTTAISGLISLFAIIASAFIKRR